MALDRPSLHGEDHINGVDPIPGLYRGLQVEQGSTVIFPTVDLIISDGLDLQDDGGGIGELTLAPYQVVFTPQLTATTTNPNKGSSSLENAVWVKRAKQVHVSGGITFGVGADLGSGDWLVTLPAPCDGVASLIGEARLTGGGNVFDLKVVYEGLTDDAGNPLAPISGGLPRFKLQYCATPPNGALQIFGSSSSWSIGSNHSLQWNLIYYSNS